MNEDKTPNPKCSKCRCYWEPKESDKKSSGLTYKTCNKCRAYDKKYKEEHVEKLKDKFTCECGGTYTIHHKLDHFKTKLHKDFVRK